jgi:hypothetical protein
MWASFSLAKGDVLWLRVGNSKRHADDIRRDRLDAWDARACIECRIISYQVADEVSRPRRCLAYRH